MSESLEITHSCLGGKLRDIELASRGRQLSVGDVSWLRLMGNVVSTGDVTGKCPSIGCGISFYTEGGGKVLHVRDAARELALQGDTPRYEPTLTPAEVLAQIPQVEAPGTLAIVSELAARVTSQEILPSAVA